MNEVKSKLILGFREYLGHTTPIVAHKLVFPTYEKPLEDLNLEARTLIFFDGISLERLDVSRDVRTRLTWKGYGKLSLRDKKPEQKNYGALVSGLISAGSIASGFPVIKEVRETLAQLKEWDDERRGKHETIDNRWNLVFGKSNISYPDLQEHQVGTATYSGRKYRPRSKALKKTIDRHHKKTDTGPIELYAGIPFENESSHVLEISYQLNISAEEQERVIAHGAKVTSPRYDGPSLSLWTNIDVTNLNPDHSRTNHHVYSRTWFSERFDQTTNKLTIPGPKFHREERIESD